MNPSRPRTWILLAVGLGAGALLGLAGGRLLFSPSGFDAQPEQEIRQEGWKFIGPLLECDVDEYPPGRGEIRFFRNDLIKFISSLEDGSSVKAVSVYFRDLNNGPWIGVSSGMEFAPASLNKVPLVIAAFKQAEVHPGFLDLRVPFPGLPDPELGRYHYVPNLVIEPGRDYTVMELIDRIAMFSDNGAAWLLGRTLDPAILKMVFQDLGLETTQTAFGPVAMLTAETLGRYFRILYNATYLTREHSELALLTFSRAAFDKGLVAGVPAGTPVSHKFGEKARQEGQQEVVWLHDAGIVYHPHLTYLLCVMTDGADFRAQEEAIASVSRFVWEEVTRQTAGRVGVR